MKSQLLIAALLLALAVCLGALAFQHQRHLALEQRQNEAIASLQKKIAALEPQAFAYQKIVAVRSLSQTAYSEARTLSSRHRTLTARDVAARK